MQLDAARGVGAVRGGRSRCRPSIVFKYVLRFIMSSLLVQRLLPATASLMRYRPVRAVM